MVAGMKWAALPVALALGLGGHALAAVGAAEAGTDAGMDAGMTEEVALAATMLSTVAIEFSQDMLQFPVDVRLFAEGNAVPAGTYRVDIATNNEWKGRTDVRFELVEGNERVAQPCFDLGLLETLGFDLVNLTEDARARMQGGGSLCRPLRELIPGAQAHYDSNALQLTVSAPQILLRREARGYVDPALWDDGISAGMLDYSYNGYRTQGGGFDRNTSHYLGLRAGVNLGAWRLRHQATGHRGDGQGAHYRAHSTYVERAIVRWKSRLTLGDTVTDGQVFDSLRLRGVRMDSDERMRPDSQRGFAPVVRGIAQSNARVSIHQLGQEIYQTNVPPGPFVIDDLYPTGIGGDLLVTITESDGRQHQFTIAYAGTAQLVRPGVTEYTLAAGRYDNPTLVNEPVFVMGNLRRGLSNSLTGYTGLLVGEGYSALLGGLAFNLPIGALAADFTFANTRTQLGSFRGNSVRATWAKILPVIGTNVSVASYRYSGSGYYDPSAAFMLRDRIAHSGGGAGVPGIPVLPGMPVGWGVIAQTKNRLVVNASQTLPGQWGYFNLSASSQDYWTRDGRDTQYQLGWNRSLRRASLGLSASRTHNVFRQRWENQYMLNLSLPLGEQGMYAHTNYTHREDGQALNASVSGMAGREQQFGFGVFANADDRDGITTQYSGGGSVSWDTSRAQIGASMSTSRGGLRQYGVSLNGGLVAFGGGVILTPQLGETIGIIEAKHAHGARLQGLGRHVRLNRRGHAVAPYLHAYRQNSVTLDPKGVSTDVAIATTLAQVAPTAGAVTFLRYETERGYSILLRGRQNNGEHLPFAATVVDDSGRHVGHIAQGGQALLRVKATQGTLTVRWGAGEEESCQLSYALPDDKRLNTGTNETHAFRHLEAVCMRNVITLTRGPTL